MEAQAEASIDKTGIFLNSDIAGRLQPYGDSGLLTDSRWWIFSLRGSSISDFHSSDSNYSRHSLRPGSITPQIKQIMATLWVVDGDFIRLPLSVLQSPDLKIYRQHQNSISSIKKQTQILSGRSAQVLDKIKKKSINTDKVCKPEINRQG